MHHMWTRVIIRVGYYTPVTGAQLLYPMSVLYPYVYNFLATGDGILETPKL